MTATNNKHWLFSRPGVARIISEACALHGVSVDDLIRQSKAQPLSRVRQCVWARIHKDMHISTLLMAAAFKRDHRTIDEGIQAHERRVAKGTP